MAWHPTWNQEPPGQGRYQYVRVRWSGQRGGMGQATKWLLIANIAVFVLVFFFRQFWMFDVGALTARETLRHFQLWRLVTYQFLHGGMTHILFNMFVLWMFGRVVEMQFGTRRFLWIYILSGIAGGVCEIAVNYLVSLRGGAYAGFDMKPIVGASAAVAGIVVAYAMLNPNSTIYIMFVLPVKAKWAAIGYAVITSWFALQGFLAPATTGPSVAHAAHLGGMVYAFLWYRSGAQVPTGIWQRMKQVLGGGGRSRRHDAGASRHHPVTGSSTYSAEDLADERRLDDILRRLHEEGLDSLSDRERKFLRKMSEKKRDDIDFDNRYRRQ